MGPEKIKWDAISVRPSRKSGTMRNALPERDGRIVYDMPRTWAKCLLDDINQAIVTEFRTEHGFTYKIESY
jgi:hypothetical protein